MAQYDSPQLNALLGGTSSPSSAPVVAPKAPKISSTSTSTYDSPALNALFTKADPVVDSLVTNTPAPIETKSLFKRTLQSMGNDVKSFWDNFTSVPKKEAVFGEGYVPTAQDNANIKSYFDKTGNDNSMDPETHIKLPGNNGQLNLPKNFISDIIKAGIELPEKAVRSYGEATGLSKTSDKRAGYSQFLQSYSESASKNVSDAIDEGVPPTAAIILGSAKAFGDFANDALIYADPLSKAGQGKNIKEVLFKKVITENKLPKTIYFNSSEVRDIWQTGTKLAATEQADFLKVIGGDTNKLKNAMKNGITIKIPTEKIVTLQDKPYWAKIKNVFGIEESAPKVLSKARGDATETVRGLLSAGNPIPSVVKEEVAASLEAHGPDLTAQALMEHTGASAAQANHVIDLVKKEQAAEALKNPKKTAQEVLNQVAPEIAFNNSTDQKQIGNFELGSFGKNSAERKALKSDRFPESELEKTQEYITDSYKASNDPKSYRKDNIAHISEMPNGEQRVIYTRKNASGKEEIINWHKISDPDFIENLKSFGAPERSRTSISSLERSSPDPLNDKGNTENVPYPKNQVNPSDIESKSQSDNQFESRVFKRLKAEHEELEGDLKYDINHAKEDIEKATKLIEEDKNQAFRVAMGIEEAPAGQTSARVNIIMAEKALSEGNNALFSQLTKNRSLKQTSRGQEIEAEKSSVTNNDTARYVKELISARLEKLGSSYLGDLKKTVTKKSGKMKAIEVIKDEVKKVRKQINRTKEMDLEEAQALLDSLMC